jgi:hypothetical protein
MLPPDCPLSLREFEILQQLAHGARPSLSSERSAAWMARKRLGAATNAEAVRIVVERGWLDWTPPPDRRGKRRKWKRKPPRDRGFPVTPAMRAYLRAFDRYLAGDQTARAEMTRQLERMRRDALTRATPRRDGTDSLSAGVRIPAGAYDRSP